MTETGASKPLPMRLSTSSPDMRCRPPPSLFTRIMPTPPSLPTVSALTAKEQLPRSTST